MYVVSPIRTEIVSLDPRNAGRRRNLQIVRKGLRKVSLACESVAFYEWWPAAGFAGSPADPMMDFRRLLLQGRNPEAKTYWWS
jgi:hypothetical protein